MTLTDFIKFIESRNLFSKEDHILLAVSGGIDSTVMAHLFHQAKFRFAIAHCNFGLRGDESDGDAAFVKSMATRMKVPFFPEKFDTETYASQHGISIQMAARELRYQWFEKIRQDHGFDYIATAHHLDDQVETFLINLIRGTGIAGLHGIPVQKGTLVRPLMFASRKEIEQYATRHETGYRTDHSNSETKYLRNKLRHEVIPILNAVNPEFSAGLTETIRRIAAFEQIGKRALEDWCVNVVKTDGKDKSVEIRHLADVTPAEPYLWALLSPFGFNETQAANIVSCLEKENRKVFISPTHRLVKDRGRLVISPIEPDHADKPVKIGLFVRKKRVTNPLMLTFERIRDAANYEIPATGNIASLDFDKLRFPLLIRRWQKGDSFHPLGMKRKKKLSDFFIDQKFSMKEKEQTWLLCSGKDIVWIVGWRIDHRYRVTGVTREILSVVTRDR